MRFYKNKRYMGIVYNKSTLYVSMEEAKASGIKKVFTRTGKPYAKCDADQWIEMPDNPVHAAKLWLDTVGDMPFTETHRVIWAGPRSDLFLSLAAGYELIIRPRTQQEKPIRSFTFLPTEPTPYFAGSIILPAVNFEEAFKSLEYELSLHDYEVNFSSDPLTVEVTHKGHTFKMKAQET